MVGSIASIVATMGTFLALASFVLRDPDVFKFKPRRKMKGAHTLNNQDRAIDKKWVQDLKNLGSQPATL